MNNLMKIVISLSFSGSILAVLMFGLKFFFRNRVSKRWQYYLWLIVVLRLLLPFSPRTSFVGTMFSKIDSITTQSTLTEPLQQVDTITQPAVNDDGMVYELTHFKHGDMFYKWLVQLTVCLHWFNPLVYFICRDIGRLCEFACDEAVIKYLDKDGRQKYGDTLINSLGIGGTYKNSLASVTLSESGEILKERMERIMDYKKMSKKSTVAMILVTIFLGVGAGEEFDVVGLLAEGEKLIILEAAEGKDDQLWYRIDKESLTEDMDVSSVEECYIRSDLVLNN